MQRQRDPGSHVTQALNLLHHLKRPAGRFFVGEDFREAEGFPVRAMGSFRVSQILPEHIDEPP